VVALSAAACGDDEQSDVQHGIEVDGGRVSASPSFEAGDVVSGDAGDAGSAPWLTFDGPLHFDGPVNAIVHDDGAWFLGGAFTRISSYGAPNFVRLDPDGEVAPCGLKLVPHTPIAFGGDSIYAVTPSGIEKFFATTCQRDMAFQAPLAGDVGSGTIYSLLVAGGSLYVGGAQNWVPFLAKLNLASGQADPTFPSPCRFDRFASGGVYALAASNRALFVGGNFGSYAGSFVNHVAKLDATTGALDTLFSPPPPRPSGFTAHSSGSPVVRALLLLGENSLYVGGDFTDYRALAGSANGIAKLDATTGELDTIFGPPAANGFGGAATSVNALLAVGSSLVVGGTFETYRGGLLAAPNLARVDLSTGALDASFQPPAAPGFALGARAAPGGYGYSVNALAASTTALYVGGQFQTDDGEGYNLAKLDLATGTLDETFRPRGSSVRGVGPVSDAFYYTRRNPAQIGLIDDLIFAGSRLWVAGGFATYGGHRANGFAKLDDRTFWLDSAICPQPRDSVLSGVETQGSGDGVHAIAATKSGVFVGGYFHTYRGQAVDTPLLKVDKRAGSLDPTFIGPGCGGGCADWLSVSAITLSGTSLYIAGQDDDRHRPTFFKSDVVYGVPDTAFHWPGELGGFFPLVLATSGESLLVGGTGSPGLAKVDLATGAIDSTFTQLGDAGMLAGHAPSVYASEALASAIAGTSLYVAGEFTDYRGVAGAANRIAKVDLASGALDTTFSPPEKNGFDATARALVVSGGALYVAGDFTTYRGEKIPAGIVKLDLATGVRDASFGAVGGIGFDRAGYGALVNVLAIADSTLIAGGEFRSYAGTTAIGWAVLDLQSGAPK
jgi:hypothetical protein